MASFSIIENSDPKWDSIVKSADIYDFHHTAFYHRIDSTNETFLLVCELQNSFIAWPIVLRPIPDTPYFDITSVYGYSGPIFKSEEGVISRDLIEEFQSGFMKFCAERRVVSAFARLHPLIEQKNILDGLGEVTDLNKTVAINLTLSNEEQRKVYRKSLKSDLNQLKKKEIVVSAASGKTDIDAFISIYYETMDRVNASPYYYFSKEYFYEFLSNNEFSSELLLAKQGEKVIAGAIFTFTKKIMQYHLAGTTDEFIKDTPMKLILDEARILGNSKSVEYLNLGGGVGGSDDDSLFRFKSGFSKDFKQFSVWKFIVNSEVYKELSKSKEQSNYFPLYRS